jgi:hypothetical protein
MINELGDKETLTIKLKKRVPCMEMEYFSLEGDVNVRAGKLEFTLKVNISLNNELRC